MKKICIIIMLCLLITGCGNNEKENTDNTNNIKQTITKEEAKIIASDINTNASYSHDDEEYYYFILDDKTNDEDNKNNKNEIRYFLVNKTTGQYEFLTKTPVSGNNN